MARRFLSGGSLSRRAALAGVGLSLLLAGGAEAHHSVSMYQIGREVTLTGTVRDFQWGNPHTWIEIVAKDAHGHDVEWSIEGASPYILERFGWTPRSLKAGEKIEAVIHPVNNGASRGILVRVIANGHAIGAMASN